MLDLLPWRHNESSKYVTGERLQSLASVTVTTPDILKVYPISVEEAAVFQDFKGGLAARPDALARLQGRPSIFVYARLLESFFREVFPKLTHRFVMLSHNGDEAIDNRFLPWLDDDRIAHWYAQNVAIRHPKLTAVPIGIANACFGHGNLAALAEVARTRHSRSRIIYANFEVATNRAVRQPILDHLRATDGVWIAPFRPFEEYLRDLAGCRWCVSPPGNGIDCHRTWEALYLGVIPVVQRSAGIEQLLDGFPAVVVDDLRSISLASVAQASEAFVAKSFDQPRLTLRYWQDRIAKQVAGLR